MPMNPQTSGNVSTPSSHAYLYHQGVAQGAKPATMEWAGLNWSPICGVLRQDKLGAHKAWTGMEGLEEKVGDPWRCCVYDPK